MTRAEQIAAVLAEHRWRDVRGDYEVAPYSKHFGCSCGGEWNIAGMSGYWSWVAVHDAHVAAALDAALAAHEGERGGAEVAAVREAALKEAGQLVRDHLFGSVDAERVAEFLDSRAARLGAAGALAKHDAEVLRAAADELDAIWNRGHDDSVHPNSHLLRERADRIEAQP